MNQTFKIFKVLFVCTFLVFLSCEKDLYEEAIVHQHESSGKKVSYLKGTKAQNVATILSNSLNNERFGNRGLENEDYIILYDYVMQVIDEKGNINYTFKVQHPDETASKFFNMILQERYDGSTLVKLMEYTMTPEFAEKYNLGEKNISEFEGNFFYRLVAFT